MNTLAALSSPQAFHLGHSAEPIALPTAPQNPEVLANSLDVLDVGLEIWDEADRLLLYNRKINRLLAGFYTPALIGKPFEAVLRSQVDRGLFPAALGREAQWLSARLAARGKSRAPQLLQLSGHQWIHLHENRTPDGCVVTGWVDVTDLVHKRQVLEARNQLLAQQSATDGLTGLANRRRLDNALGTEWQRAARNNASLSLLMLDIDHFKHYNDHYGHLAGDECLRRVAERLSQCVSRAVSGPPWHASDGAVGLAAPAAAQPASGHGHAGAPAHAAPFLCQPCAAVQQRPARRARAAGPRQHQHHPGLHPPGLSAPGQGL